MKNKGWKIKCIPRAGSRAKTAGGVAAHARMDQQSSDDNDGTNNILII